MARDHEPLVIEEFGGWWNRGDPESAPSDHFIRADNVQYYHSAVETRFGVITYVWDPGPVLKVQRVYNYTTLTGQTLLALTEGGNIYHIKGNPKTAIGPILTIPAMEDFGFVAINGRAYITPFKTYTNTEGEKYQLGLQNEAVYVYLGDGTPARKAAGPPPTGGALALAEDGAGRMDPGKHLIAVVYETDTGYLTALGPQVFGELTYSGLAKIDVTNIPVSPNSYVKKRHLVSTKTIPGIYNGDQTGYQFFFIPNGTIPNNIDTIKTVEYFDSDLISDASHLIDNFSEIPAGVTLNTYHSRLVIVGEYGNAETLTGLPAGVTDNRSIARLSNPGEPESISKIDGLLIVPLDGTPLTNVQEFRDSLYLFKRSRTYVYSDNYDVPSTWQEEVLDQGFGAPVHGIATVLDSGGVNIDFLLVVGWPGLLLFNGTYSHPELSWKIEDFWKLLNRNEFNAMQVVNDTINEKIWITLPSPFQKMVLHADYGNGMDAKNIRWARWLFHANVLSITLTETDKLILGTIGPDPVIGEPTEVNDANNE